MKVGLIFECGPKGPDIKVCEYLIKHHIRPEHGQPSDPPISITLERKSDLIDNCGKAAASLLSDGCDRVVVIWDLYPRFGQPPLRCQDRENIHASLRSEAVPLDRVHLVCIEAELEAWLMADGRALSAFLSSPEHPVKIKDKKNPDRVKNPKTALKKLFTDQKRSAYDDLSHAIKIAQNLPDLSKLRAISSFARFEGFVTGLKP